MQQELIEFQSKFNALNFQNDTEIINYFKDKKNSKDWKMLKALVEFFFGEKVKGCNNCIVDYFIKILKFVATTIISKHKIFNGVVLEDYRNKEKENVTSKNLNDDLAEYYLKNYPEYKKYFIK